MIRCAVLAAALASISTACDGAQSLPRSRPSSADSTLVQGLQDDRFGLTFLWPMHDQTIARIQAVSDSTARLEAIIDDRTAPAKARLIAAEALFDHDASFLARHDQKEVARIYTDALAQHAVPGANSWGMLWLNGRSGLLGDRIFFLGEAAIPVLKSLLDNSTVVDWYEGSEAATLGNMQRYRIKDFAAWYLAEITGHPIAFHRDNAERDAEIAKLLASIQH